MSDRPYQAAVIFDIDNTLIDNPTAHMDAMADVTERLTGTRRTVEPRYHGLTDYQILTQCLAEGGLSPERIAAGMPEYFEQMTAVYQERVTMAPPQALSGAVELVAAISEAGYRLGVVSGNVPTIAWDKLARVGLRKYFQAGAFGDRPLERHQLVSELLGKLGITPEHAVVIGDTPRDVAAGHTAGTRTIGVATGWSTQTALEKAGAEVAVADLSDTDTVLKRIGALI